MLGKIASSIDNLNELIGRTVSWLVAAMVLITFAIVVLRYGFNAGSIAVQESVTYLHCIVFMLAIAYTFKHDKHVRIDIFYCEFTEYRRAWTNLLGTILLLFPFCIYLALSSLDYARNSWDVLEGSREAGGLPLVFILKSLIPLMPALLFLQGVATICRCLLVINTYRVK